MNNSVWTSCSKFFLLVVVSTRRQQRAFVSKQAGGAFDLGFSSNNENEDVEGHIFVTETYVNICL